MVWETGFISGTQQRISVRFHSSGNTRAAKGQVPTHLLVKPIPYKSQHANVGIGEGVWVGEGVRVGREVRVVCSCSRLLMVCVLS